MSDRECVALLSRILGVLGAGAAPFAVSVACGGATKDSIASGSTGEGGASGGRTVDSGAAPSSGGASHATGGSGSSKGGAGSGGVLIVPSAGGVPRDSGLVLPTYAITSLPAECPSFPRPSDATTQPDGQARCSDAASKEYRFERVCLPLSDGETCDDVNPMCAANSYDCGLDTRAHFVCGPLPAEFGECCYVLAGGCAVGRPFLVDEVARVATVVCAPGFAFDSMPAMAALAPLERAELASAWAREGLAEHASVASFSRFTLECLALGAPPDIVADSARAALEELSHARRCFGLASAYAGAPLGPGRLAMDGALDEPPDLARVAAAVAREGCIAETVSALLLAAARDAAVDPVVKGELAAMIEEEHRHVVLAWRFVRWALETGGESVRRTVQGAFQRAGDHVGFGAVSSADASPSVLRAHGRLSISERRDVARGALRQVVGEAARVLFETSPATTAPSS